MHSEIYDDPKNGGESLVTSVFVEEGGKTTLTTTMRFDTKEIRDAVLRSGMERGVAVSYDRLDNVLESMTSQRT